MFIKDLFLITLTGLFRIYREILDYCVLHWLRLTIFDRAASFVLLFQFLFSLQKWMSYSVEMLPGEKLVHGIYSNDYLAFLFFIVLCGIPYPFRLLENTRHKIKIHWSDYVRLVSLFILSFYYLLNLLQPSRIALAEEASFTVWFYFFGAGLALLIALSIFDLMAKTRILGIKPMPRIHAGGR